MSGLILIIIIIFVVVPLVKKFKESLDAGETKNRNRYGGYNNPNIYNNQNSKKITYDWKPDYNFQSNKSDQVNHGNQEGQGQNAADEPMNDLYRNTSVQAGVKSTAPAVNARPSSSAAKANPSSAQTNAWPFSTAVSGDRAASAEVNNSKKKITAASIRKELHKNQMAGLTDTDNIDGVHVSNKFFDQDIEMPVFDSFEYSASSYEVPESDAFRYTDVIVDSEVHVNAVMPGLEDNVKKDGQI